MSAKRRKVAAKKAPARSRATRVRAFRLTEDVRPDEVDVDVEVDPNRSPTFRGVVSIELQLARGRRTLELHAADLRVSRPRLTLPGEERPRIGRITPRPDRQTVQIAFDRVIPAGPARLELGFAGRLRSDLCGLYGARVGDERYAFSQLEAADARKFFPCFDEPAMKARFQLSVTTASSNAVVSNSPPEQLEQLADGRKTVRFARTPRLSSYLVALAVGRLECSEPVWAGETEIRTWYAPGKEGLSDFALEAARETLILLERYFDLPYPYEKLDLVAVPDFEFGAMENAGAVFFRETLLLMDPTTVTQAEKKRAAEVICHELAHMWYGDLVTMAWWDDLWLNEAFATWMAFTIVDQWKPEWKMWQDFQHHRSAALDLDALANTHPIYAEVRTPDDANENFDVITYEKGASVVRMIERYLGDDSFRKGVRLYIRRHAEGNTVAADLWKALSEASGEKVEPVVRAWIQQEGYPSVSVRSVESDGRATLELTQERFFSSRAAARRAKGRARWPIPWVGRLGTAEAGSSHTLRHMLRKRRDQVTHDGGDFRFVYGNADEGGFFRPIHGEAELRALLQNLGNLSAVERLGLVDHQWALARAGRAGISSLLELLAALGSEQDPDVLAAARRPLSTLTLRLEPDVDPDGPGRMNAWIAQRFGAQLGELGWDPGPGESDDTRLRRARILEILGGVAGVPDVLDEACRRSDAYLEDRRSLDPDLADAVVSMAASRGDAALHDRFRSAMRGATTPQEHRRFLLALGDFRATQLIDRTLSLSLGEEVATQDVAFLFVRLFENRWARERTWSFLKRRWPRLRKRVAPMLMSRLIAATPALGTRAHRRDVAGFFRQHPVPAGARSLRQALERFDWYEEFKRRAGPELLSSLD